MLEKMKEVREWAREMHRDPTNPHWQIYQCLKLIEALNFFIRGQMAADSMEDLLESESHWESDIPPVGVGHRQEISPHHLVDVLEC